MNDGTILNTLNVASVTVSSTIYTVSFLTSLPGTPAVVASGYGITNTPAIGSFQSPSTSSVQVGNSGVTGAYYPVSAAYSMAAFA